jgi:hypothetical protein
MVAAGSDGFARSTPSFELTGAAASGIDGAPALDDQLRPSIGAQGVVTRTLCLNPGGEYA